MQKKVTEKQDQDRILVREPHDLALTDGSGRIAGVILMVPLAFDSVGFWGLCTGHQWSSSEVLRFGNILVKLL